MAELDITSILELQVTTISGHTNALAVESKQSIQSIKVEIQNVLAVPSGEQRLLLGERILKDFEVLGDVIKEEYADAIGQVCPRVLHLSMVRLNTQKMSALAGIEAGTLKWNSLPQNLRDDYDVVLAVIEKDGRDLCHVPQPFQDDFQIVMAAVRQDKSVYVGGRALEFASERLKSNKEIVSAAVSRHGPSLLFASMALRHDRGLMIDLLASCHNPDLRLVPDELREDKDLVLSVLQRVPDQLQHASATLRSNREVVTAALRRDGRAIRWASEELRSDREIALLAVSCNGIALSRVAEHLKADDEVVFTALREYGGALGYLPLEMRKRKDIVLTALHSDPMALRFAAPAMRADKEVALLAVRGDGRALIYVEDSIKADVEIVDAACKEYKDADKLSAPDSTMAHWSPC